MLKLVYDLKAGFDDCYLTIKDEEYDLADAIELINDREVITVTEAEFYDEYKNDLEKLLEYLENAWLLRVLYEDSVLEISKLYFSHKLGGVPLKQFIPIWEPSNWRLVYEPNVRSNTFYVNAMSAKEVCDLLKLTRQQLHYYVTTGAIKKEFNPDKPNSFKYNRTDVYVLQKKLEKKYDRFK